MSGASYKIETECHCKPGDPYACQIHHKDPVIRAAAWQYRCELAERQSEEWHSAETFMAEQAALERARASKAESSLAESEARRAEAERWQEEVAEGLGYLNRAEGQDGYEVAATSVIIEAFRAAEKVSASAAASKAWAVRHREERDAALARAEAIDAEFTAYRNEREPKYWERAEAAERSLAAAVEVLRQVQWRMRHESGMVNDWYCPVCGGYKSRGHANDCPLARALGGSHG